MVASVSTSKKINPSQLGVEMGRVPLRVVGPDEDDQTRIESDAVTQSALDSAVAAHVADGAWVDPQYVPPLDPDDEFRKAIEAATSLNGLKAALLGITGPGAEPRSR